MRFVRLITPQEIEKSVTFFDCLQDGRLQMEPARTKFRLGRIEGGLINEHALVINIAAVEGHRFAVNLGPMQAQLALFQKASTRLMEKHLEPSIAETTSVAEAVAPLLVQTMLDPEPSFEVAQACHAMKDGPT